MGMQIERAIIVSSWDSGKLREAHRLARRLFDADPAMVTSIAQHMMNSGGSFAVFTSGSKLGWQTEKEHTDAMVGLRSWLKSQVYQDGSSMLSWVEVRYGECAASIESTHGEVVVSHGD